MSITNCVSCKSTDYSLCEKCNSSYYLTENLCKSCIKYCISCSVNDFCEVCQDDYILNEEKTQCNPLNKNETACLTIWGCAKCTQKNTNECALCKEGTIPTETNVCTCEDGYLLVAGTCVLQETNTINFDAIEEKTIDDLIKYVNQAKEGNQKKENTEKILKQLKSIIFPKVDSQTKNQAATLLYSLANTATNSESQIYYQETLQTICEISSLDNYYTIEAAITAADKFYTKTSKKGLRQAIYEQGFQLCVNSYLKQAEPSDISLMALTNSEFQLKSLSVDDETDTQFSFADSTSIVINSNFKSYLKNISTTKEYYFVVQSINNNADPYIENQKNLLPLKSKIMSLTVLSKDKNSETIPHEVEIQSNFSITFDHDGNQCMYYNTTTSAWEVDGNPLNKTCYYNHTAHFMLYESKDLQESQIEIAYLLANCWLLLLILLVII